MTTPLPLLDKSTSIAAAGAARNQCEAACGLSEEMMAHLCIAPTCTGNCCDCNPAISPETATEYARRYAWLRAQHWETAPLAVVAEPKRAVKRGHYLPSGDRLDEAIDAAMLAAAA